MASEHPGIKANFIRGRIEEFLSTVKAGEYDLVLGLSVLHNISKYLGVQNVQALMADLSQKVVAGIFEFALERVHSSYIPADYRDFLPSFAFIRGLIASDHRNGSGIKRLLCFASNKYMWFEKFGALKIDNISYHVHTYMRKQDLIHFHCGDKFVKFFYVKSQAQLLKAQQEINFLKNFGGQKGLPKLLATHVEQDQNGIRIFIVRDKLNGMTLSEKISSAEKIDRWDIVKQALEWMVFLEERGYYHGDIQTPNFIYSTDGKLYPIDYEEIRREPIVLIWPYKVSLLFLIFMNAVLDSRVESSGFHRELRLLTALKKHLSPRQYDQISAIKDSEKFFAQLHEILFQSEKTSVSTHTLQDLEFLSAEKFLDDVSQRLKENQKTLEQMNGNMAQLTNYVNKLSNTITAQQNRITHLEKIIRGKIHD